MLDMAWPAIWARLGYSTKVLAQVGRLVQAADADHQNAVGSQVDGGRDGRGLAHRTVAAVVIASLHRQLDRRKDEGNGRGGQQVVDVELIAHAQALGARPGGDVHGRCRRR
jgi:hypothetical protein